MTSSVLGIDYFGKAFDQSKLPWRGSVYQSDRANFLARAYCGRGKRAAVDEVKEWALGMSVKWASPSARALDGLYLEHLDQPSQDTGRRLVSGPLPEVTSLRPSGGWLRIAIHTVSSARVKGLLPYPRSLPRPCACCQTHLVPCPSGFPAI